MIRDYQFQLGAGVHEPRTINGNQIHFRACSDSDAAVTVRAFDNGGKAVIDTPLKQGQSIVIPERFVGVFIENNTAAALICNFVIGEGGYSDDRPNGTVSVSGVVTTRPVSLSSYPVFVKSVNAAAVSGQYGACFIRNPAGSGVDLYFIEITAKTGSGAGSVSRFPSDADIPALSVVPKSFTLDAGGNSQYTRMGAFTAANRADNQYSIVTGGEDFGGDMVSWKPPQEFALAEGEDLMLMNTVVNNLTQLFVIFEERPNV